MKDYAKHINANDYVLQWVDTILAEEIKNNNPATEEMEHILDWFVQYSGRVGKMTYKQAKNKADKWTKKLQKQAEKIEELPEDTENILDFGDGFKIVKLIGENAYKREGYLMRHCVASYFGKDVEVYSLRDSKNMPHCTMEKDQQIKGKGNGDINPKYIDYVVRFLEKMDMEVSDSEMKHLGYINIERVDENAVFEPLYKNKYFYKSGKIKDKEGNKYESISLWDKFKLVEFNNNKLTFNFDIDNSIKTFLSFLNKKTTAVANESYSTAVANSNFSTAVANKHSSTAVANESFSTAVANSSFSTAVANSSYSTAVANKHSSTAVANESFSTAVANSSFSTAVANSSYSTAVANSSSSTAVANSSYSTAVANSSFSTAVANKHSSTAVANKHSSTAVANESYSTAVANESYSTAVANSTYSTAVLSNSYKSKAKVSEGSALFIVERKNKEIINVYAGIGGQGEVKANTWYTLIDGKLTEVNN